MSDALPLRKTLFTRAWPLLMLWILTFIIYLPAAKAGWVIDSAGWLYNIRNLKFWNYINNSQSGIPSLYQFTQFATWIFYKAFNANPYAWHTLQVTMHAINSFLLFLVCKQLFFDSGAKNGQAIALWGAILYTVCPHISEVIVWEAAYHYLQGFLFILLILYWLQKFQHQPSKKYAWLAGIIFLCSTYSLEIFYLTPWFCLAFILYYRYVLDYDKTIFKKALLWFVVPQLVMFVMHLIVLMVVYSHFAHIANNLFHPFSVYISRPPEYLFHVVFLGRFFSDATRKQVYDALISNAGLIIFYNIIVLIWCSLVSRYTKMGSKGRVGILLFVCIMISMVILMPLAFPEFAMVFYDRYTYFLDAFVYMLFAMLVSYIPVKVIRIVVLSAYALLNLYFTTIVNLNWKRSAYIDNRLLKEMPNPGNKTVVLLNIPQNMNGIPMIGAQRDGAFKKSYNLFVDKNLNNKIYEASAYNMTTKNDGAHVLVVNDTVLRVTLNQWGTWWWYEDYGGRSYENDDYRLIMRDPGHWFDIQLKHPSSDYELLFQQGDQWKVVNMKKMNEDQY
jgi:rod shape-determining protein MreD